MQPEPFPHDWGGGPPLSHTLPQYVNSGDVIDRQTLLMRAVSGTNGVEQRLPSNPFVIFKSVQAVLQSNPNKVLTAVKEVRGTRYVLRTTSRKAYQALLGMKALANGQPIEVIPHPTLNLVQGVVYDPDTVNMNTDELLEELKEQNVTAIRRITKLLDGKVTNTPLSVLSFAGSFLPEFIYMGLVRTKIRPYYPAPMLCYNCGRFGHGSRSCPNQQVCLNCGDEHQTSKEQPCKNVSKCINCEGEHSTRDRKCPTYLEEEV
ncbi:uncharacterized protein LOC131680235 [Topomyia yanbarensis]|uniref:uncharacterized protein LOC131680235 n=1 Tax=Topomyia yanbarensis TaxID=2498891 RepID=UPI00273BF9CE|nr:uncharacterized protein LOC131680235 [Topomyia yanbarensis]